MAVDQIEPVVRNFVAQGSSEVLVLKGNWGVGKTHFWHRLIEKQTTEVGNVETEGFWGRMMNDENQEVAIGKEKYSYISLFGVNSLDDLKRSIFTSVIDTSTIHDDELNSGLKSLQKRVRDLVGGASGIPKVAEWGGEAVAEKFLFNGVENALICIDDLERRGGNMQIRDLLGLASLLKEERGCQVVLILNEDALKEDAREEFETYGEKLVDIEVEFERSPDDAFACVFDDDDEFASVLSDSVSQLEIRNVRIVQRLKRLTRKLKPYLEECEPQTERSALETLTLLVWSYYGEEDRSPSIDDLRQHDVLYNQLADEEEGEWTQVLQNYGYSSFDELDSVLLSLIKRGYLTDEEIQRQIDRVDEESRAQEASSRLRATWDIYHGSFDDNEEEFAEELIQAVDATLDYISVRNLDNAVEVLRTLGREEDADRLIDAYVQRHEGNTEKLDLSEMMRGRDVTDSQLRSALNEAVKEIEDSKTVSEALRRVSSGQSWGGSDKSFLSKASPDEYYDFFKSARGKELRDAVKWCLDIGQLAETDSDEEYEAIHHNAMEALSRIADESKLNQIRLSEIYGVEMGEPETDE